MGTDEWIERLASEQRIEIDCVLWVVWTYHVCRSAVCGLVYSYSAAAGSGSSEVMGAGAIDTSAAGCDGAEAGVEGAAFEPFAEAVLPFTEVTTGEETAAAAVVVPAVFVSDLSDFSFDARREDLTHRMQHITRISDGVGMKQSLKTRHTVIASASASRRESGAGDCRDHAIANANADRRDAHHHRDRH